MDILSFLLGVELSDTTPTLFYCVCLVYRVTVKNISTVYLWSRET